MGFYTLTANYQKEKLRKQLTIVSKRIKYLGINLGGGKRVTWQTVRHWWKKLKLTETNGKICGAPGLEELTLLKLLYYLRKSTDSM